MSKHKPKKIIEKDKIPAEIEVKDISVEPKIEKIETAQKDNDSKDDLKKTDNSANKTLTFEQISILAITLIASLLACSLLILGIGFFNYQIFKKNTARQISDLNTQVDSLQKSQTGLLDSLEPVLGKLPKPKPTNLNDLPEPNLDVEPYIGNPKAEKVWIVYSDFQCPYCKQMHFELKKLVEQNKDIAVVFRHYPLTGIHQKAVAYALTSECAKDQKGSEGFWKMADEIFATDQDLTDTELLESAKKANLDTQKLQQCLQENKFADKVNQDKKNADELLGQYGFGTPTNVIYSTKTKQNKVNSGFLPVDNMQQVLKND